MSPTTGQEQGKVQEQAKAQEKENVERAAAATGAQAVAEAVSKVAQAAVEQVKSESSSKSLIGDFSVEGTPGGTFELRAHSGPIFSSGGSVFINGKPQVVDEWGADRIRGRLDADVKSGEVVVPIDEKSRLVGYLKV